MAHARLLVTRPALAAALVLVALGGARSGFANPHLEDRTLSFPSGPYTAITVDAATGEAAVGTEDGRIGWSRGTGTAEARVVHPRRYDPVILRGQGSRAALAMRTETMRSTRLFMYQLARGLPAARYAHWMTLGETPTVVTGLAMAGGPGPGYVATLDGLYATDGHGTGWYRVLGTAPPGPRSRGLAVFSVVADPGSPRHILVGTSLGVFESRDGGRTFAPHPSPELAGDPIFDWSWSAAEPSLIIALSAGGMFMSSDGGNSFEFLYAPDSELRAAVLMDGRALVATKEGLEAVTPEGRERLSVGEEAVGVARLGSGLLFASPHTLYWLGSDRRYPLFESQRLDPIVAVQEAPGGAWVLTRSRVIHVSWREEPYSGNRTRQRCTRLLVSAIEVERSVVERTGIGGPLATRLHDRWYARLIPRVTAEVFATRERSETVTHDGTFVLGPRTTESESGREAGWSIVALWDMSQFVFGDSNASNPDLMLEAQLRNNRDRILRDVRRRYRESQDLLQSLCTRVGSEREALTWRTRLEENVAYLEYLSGRQLLETP